MSNELNEQLIGAVKSGEIAAVNRLLAEEANPNAADKNSWTALKWAIMRENAKIAEVLLSAGANPNAADDVGNTVLDSAASDGNAGAVKMLLSVGANPNLSNYSGSTALHSAAFSGSAEIAELLLAAGANPNAKGGYLNKTALHVVVRTDRRCSRWQGGKRFLCNNASEKDADVVETLLSFGANSNATDDRGWTAWDYANDHKRTHIVHLLEQAGAKKSGILRRIRFMWSNAR